MITFSKGHSANDVPNIIIDGSGECRVDTF